MSFKNESGAFSSIFFISASADSDSFFFHSEYTQSSISCLFTPFALYTKSANFVLNAVFFNKAFHHFLPRFSIVQTNAHLVVSHVKKPTAAHNNHHDTELDTRSFIELLICSTKSFLITHLANS
jgi:hypothetical protein